MDIMTTSEGQKETAPLADLKRKDHYKGKVIKITLAGAIVDLGLEVPGVVHISQLQAEPVNRVEDVVQVGQEVEVWVRRVFPKKNRIELTMVKPLSLEWREIEVQMVLKGKVVRLEKYGVFVDIGAERPGLVHISEMSHDYVKGPEDVVKEGDEIDVKVLQVSRRKKQIKLSMKALQEPQAPAEKPATTTKRTARGKNASEAEHQAQLAEANADNAAAEVEEHLPTAMELALRRAMERSKEEDESASHKKSTAKEKKVVMDDILTRTLGTRQPS